MKRKHRTKLKDLGMAKKIKVIKKLEDKEQ